jgi:hypothetical protein
MSTNRLTLTRPDGSSEWVSIATGSAINARKVPAGFASIVLSAPQGSTLAIETARGPKPRRIVKSNGRYYTREVR